MTETTPCRVCDEAITPDRAATCDNCQEPFHLRTRQDQDDDDCGNVWINDQYLSLEFACNVCLGKAGEEPAIGEAH